MMGAINNYREKYPNSWVRMFNERSAPSGSILVDRYKKKTKIRSETEGYLVASLKAEIAQTVTLVAPWSTM
jgi:hypothetical protein